ncbi:MAG: DUF3606 domain-containing protein [Burkholderiaceae bacterium]
MNKCKRCALGMVVPSACLSSLEAQMADDPKKKGKSDRSRVSSQDHEVKYVARKTGTSSAEVRQAKAGAKGTGRKEVEQKLKK